VGLTRSKVRETLLELRDAVESRECGLLVAHRDGLGALSEESLETIYRDGRRCLFCDKCSQAMSGAMVEVEPPMDLVLGGPRQAHIRLALYGMCRSHHTRARKDADVWEARARFR
jgi:hypothetical protein